MKILYRLIIGSLAAALSCASLAAVEVGEVTFARGVVTGQIDGEQPRIIGKGVGLHNGETLNTGSRAFALLQFNDGTRMTLRRKETCGPLAASRDSGASFRAFSMEARAASCLPCAWRVSARSSIASSASGCSSPTVRQRSFNVFRWRSSN